MMMEAKRKELEVLKLINQNNNWEEILSSSPYNLIIKHKDNFVLLKYNQLESDMSNNIVQECRGLILKNVNGIYKVSSMRFTKFFNYGQKEAATLELPCIASEKVDGSLVGVWFDEDSGWHVSTSGNIDAEDASMVGVADFNSFRDLFNSVWNNEYFNILDKNLTYMFELVSPYNKLVVSYPKTSLYLLAIRNNITLEEYSFDKVVEIGHKTFNNDILYPKYFICNSIEEMKEQAEKLKDTDDNWEGFVLCDKNFNRIKLKSPLYTELFFFRGEGIFNNKKILKIIFDEQDDDILGYFPEYKDAFDKMRRGLAKFIQSSKDTLSLVSQWSNLPKKEFAQNIKDLKYKDVAFKAYDCQLWDKDEDFYFNFMKSYLDNLYALHFPTLLQYVEDESNE